MVEHALIGARYNKSEAARALGLTRAQFYVRLKRHGLELTSSECVGPAASKRLREGAEPTYRAVLLSSALLCCLCSFQTDTLRIYRHFAH